MIQVPLTQDMRTLGSKFVTTRRRFLASFVPSSRPEHGVSGVLDRDRGWVGGVWSALGRGVQVGGVIWADLWN